MSTPSLRTRSEAALEVLINQVRANPIPSLGLLDGFAGQALFACYADVYKETEFEDTINSFNALQQKLSDMPYKGAYISDGLAGVVWYLQHLYELEMLDDNEALEPLLNGLVKETEIELEAGRYEFLYGAMGLAIALLGTSAEQEAVPRILQVLKDKASKGKTGHYWPSDSEKRNVQLTASHGVLGILFFLLKVYDRGLEQPTCKALVEGLFDYLLPTEFEQPSRSLFPYETGENIEENDSKRVAWCYGDLMIGYGFLWAGKSLSNDSYTTKGLQITNWVAGRKDLKDTACNDAMLCHGAIGVSQAFHRIYQLTQDPKHRETQEYWLGVTLDYLENSDFKAVFFDFDTLEHEVRHSLLEGTAGIGLGLITYLSPELDGWDGVMLLS